MGGRSSVIDMWCFHGHSIAQPPKSLGSGDFVCKVHLVQFQLKYTQVHVQGHLSLQAWISVLEPELGCTWTWVGEVLPNPPFRVGASPKSAPWKLKRPFFICYQWSDHWIGLNGFCRKIIKFQNSKSIIQPKFELQPQLALQQDILSDSCAQYL